MAVKPRDGWQPKHDEVAEKAGKESWVAWIEEIEGDLGRVICGGMADPSGKRDGPKPCGAPPMANGRCKHHRGNANWGPFHPNFQGKGTSKYLPTDILAKYREIDDEELLSMLDLLRTAHAMHRKLLASMADGETSEKWETIRSLSEELDEALDEGDDERVEALGRRIVNAVRGGPSFSEMLEAVREQEDHIRKLFASQTARDKVEADWMHIREVLTLYEEIATDIAEVLSHLKDERTELAKRMRNRLGPVWRESRN